MPCIATVRRKYEYAAWRLIRINPHDTEVTGATLLDPADEGALTFRVEPGRTLEPERYRRDQRRYWHGP